ncbi:potassium channel family protein [Novosphingobium profundi]|uniref:potassium channel family protein n=1 Tax=Novosphingobium profundi TaxID=1774954 RepID=UPI001BD9F755|nr:potassium channel family protein [Novosphingobium profundi]MBT0666778.1 potassium channel family protein [Novosphingobium profundi]
MPRPQRPKRRTPPAVFNPLRRALAVPVWADVALRIGAALALISIVVLVHWLDREGLRDGYDNDVSFLDVVYFTMISITTTGFGDIAPVSDKSRLVEAIIVTPIRLAVIYIFVGTAYNFIIKRSWETWRMKRIQERLENHVVVLGYGVSGSEAVAELIARDTDPSDIVVIDSSPARLAQAEQAGCNVLEGDATRDETLNAVRITRARTVLVSAGRDDTTILIILTARHLAPKVPITAVVRADDNELLARQAGADNVINPVRFTGLLLAGSAQGKHISEYMSDLASVSGRVQLVERAVKAEEIGRPLDAIATGKGLRIYRGTRAIGFWQDEARALAAGDVIVEITATGQDDDSLARSA